MIAKTIFSRFVKLQEIVEFRCFYFQSPKQRFIFVFGICDMEALNTLPQHPLPGFNIFSDLQRQNADSSPTYSWNSLK